MFRVVRKSEGEVRKIGKGMIALNLITKDITKEVSLAITERNNSHEKVTTQYNRIYCVIEGSLKMRINRKTTNLGPGDCCFLSKETNYEISGTFKAVTINQPAFGT